MVSINNSISNKVGASNTGVTNTLTVDNASNTSSSAALLNITVGGTTAGDPFETFTVAGTTNWSLGADNSVTGDPFVIAASTALGTTNIMSALITGEIIYPLQPAILVGRTTDLSAVVGNSATPYLIIFNSEVKDRGGDYDNTTGVFTAPVTGRYQFSNGIRLNALTAAMTYGEVQLVASNRTLIGMRINAGFVKTTSVDVVDFMALAHAALMDMDAADTISTKIIVNGGASAAANVFGGAAIQGAAYFSGFLAC